MAVSMGTVLTNALSISPKIWLKSQQMVPLRLPKPKAWKPNICHKLSMNDWKPTFKSRVICMKTHKNVLSLHDINHHIKIHSYLENHSFSLCHYVLHRSNKTGWMSTLAIRSLEYLTSLCGTQTKGLKGFSLGLAVGSWGLSWGLSSSHFVSPKKRINTHPTFNFLFDTQKHCYNYNYFYIHKPPPPCSVDDFIIPKKKSPPKKRVEKRWV